MIKSKIKYLVSAGAIVIATIGLSSTAQAQSFRTVKEGNFSGAGAFLPRACGSVFYSYFSVGMRNNNSSLFTDLLCTARPRNTRSHFKLNWNGDSNGDDYVAGVGWNSQNANKTRTITFDVKRYGPSATSPGGRPAPSGTPQVSTMGVYGWLCPTRNGTMIEYYVVDGWYQRNSSNGTFPSSFIPFANTARGSGTINGVTYDFYSSGNITRGNGCRAGNATFRQLWAVRRTEKNTGRRTIKMSDFFNFWNGKVSTAAPAGYQIVGVEGIGANRGVFEAILSN